MLYQPLQNVNVDERMVKRKALCHLVQYIKINLSCGGSNTGDTTGYTVSFDHYTGRETDCSEFCLAYDVVI